MGWRSLNPDVPPSQIDPRKHAKYERKLSDYCAVYGVESDRAIKYWIKTGKKLGRLPPLDEPEKMAAWWAAAMVTRVPEKFLSFLKEPTTTQLPAIASGKTPPTDTGEPRDFSDVESLDPEQNVAALRHSLAVTKKLMDEALHGRDENLISLRTRNYNSTFDLWRLAEQTLVKVQEARGHLISREAITAELAQACETLSLMRQNMPGRVIIELEKVLPRRFARILRALEPHLLNAIDRARASEEQILRNLDSIDGPSAVTALLAA